MIQEFIITDHAKQRLATRLETKPFKFIKVAKKAWNSKPVFGKLINRMLYAKQFADRKNIVYREMMGYVFVFSVSTNGKFKTLITLYN